VEDGGPRRRNLVRPARRRTRVARH
jgi:hypothetical protein